MSIFGRWDSWEDQIRFISSIHGSILDLIGLPPCLQINVMQIERKETTGIMKYGIRDPVKSRGKALILMWLDNDMFHVWCFMSDISVAAAARCRCRRVTPRRTFSHQNIQGQSVCCRHPSLLLPTQWPLVTHMRVRSQYSHYYKMAGVSQWLVCPAPPQHPLQAASWDPLDATTLLRLRQSRVPEPGDKIEEYVDISIWLLSLFISCLNSL